MAWPVDQPNPPVLPHKRVIAARELPTTMAAEYPPGTPINVIRMHAGALLADNEQTQIIKDYETNNPATPETEAQPQPAAPMSSTQSQSTGGQDDIALSPPPQS